MIDNLTLEDVIRQHVYLSPHSSGKWEQVVHPGCDHGRKGKRAAFLFENNVTVFHCFNCSVKTAYDPNKHATMPFKMKAVLAAFGISQTDWEPVLLSGLQLRRSSNAVVQPARIHKIDPAVIPLPDNFYLLADADPDDKWAKIAREYIILNRGLDPDIHPFMLSKPTDHPDSKKWKGRLIVPVYKEEHLIFYQGRAFGDNQRKYLSPTVEKSKILFGFDQLFNGSALPIFIVEGMFDALSINGVATIGNTLSDEQIQWLARSPRDKVLIPDQQGDGHIMAHQALDQGWAVSIPDISEDCKDVNDAVCKYGLLYTIKTITDNIDTGFAAEAAIELKCERSNQNHNWRTR